MYNTLYIKMNFLHDDCLMDLECNECKKELNI